MIRIYKVSSILLLCFGAAAIYGFGVTPIRASAEVPSSVPNSNAASASQTAPALNWVPVAQPHAIPALAQAAQTMVNQSAVAAAAEPQKTFPRKFWKELRALETAMRHCLVRATSSLRATLNAWQTAQSPDGEYLIELDRNLDQAYALPDTQTIQLDISTPAKAQAMTTEILGVITSAQPIQKIICDYISPEEKITINRKKLENLYFIIHLALDQSILVEMNNYLKDCKKFTTEMLTTNPQKFHAFREFQRQGVAWPHTASMRRLFENHGLVVRPMMIKRDCMVCPQCSSQCNGIYASDRPLFYHKETCPKRISGLFICNATDASQIKVSQLICNSLGHIEKYKADYLLRYYKAAREQMQRSLDSLLPKVLWPIIADYVATDPDEKPKKIMCGYEKHTISTPIQIESKSTIDIMKTYLNLRSAVSELHGWKHVAFFIDHGLEKYKKYRDRLDEIQQIMEGERSSSL